MEHWTTTLLSWILTNLPTSVLMKSLNERLKSQRRKGPVSRGPQTRDNPPDPCLEQRNAFEAATVELDDVIALVQVRAEALMNCEMEHSGAATSTEISAAIDLKGSLSLFVQG